MGRKRRSLPDNDDGILVEVSCRTIGGLALLRPSRKLPEITAGVIGRALEISPLEVAAFSCLSNHYHGLLIVDDQQSLSRFMDHLQGTSPRKLVASSTGRPRSGRVATTESWSPTSAMPSGRGSSTSCQPGSRRGLWNRRSRGRA